MCAPCRTWPRWLGELQQAKRQVCKCDWVPLPREQQAWLLPRGRLRSTGVVAGSLCLPCRMRRAGLGARPRQVGRRTQHGWKAWCALAEKLELGPRALKLGVSGGVRAWAAPPWRHLALPRGEAGQASPILVRARCRQHEKPCQLAHHEYKRSRILLTCASRCWLIEQDAGLRLPATATLLSCCGAVGWACGEFLTANGC